MWVASSQSNSISFEGYTQAHACMSNVGPGQKLNLQGGWTYIHAFHSSNQSFGTFLTLKILNLHPELNLHPWLIHQCACVWRLAVITDTRKKLAPVHGRPGLDYLHRTCAPSIGTLHVYNIHKIFGLRGPRPLLTLKHINFPIAF